MSQPGRHRATPANRLPRLLAGVAAAIVALAVWVILTDQPRQPTPPAPTGCGLNATGPCWKPNAVWRRAIDTPESPR